MKRFLPLLALLLLSVATVQHAQAGKRVRNVILLIGDGMGLAHLSLMEIEQQFQPTAFERAEAVALVATRSANNRVTDSAAAGTALATGTKTDNSTVGLSPEGEVLTSMMERARDKGLATGLVVTSELQHATPAAFYAHARKRGDYATINEQLTACDFDVLMGGGAHWLNGACREQLAQRGYHVATTLDEAEQVDKGRLVAVMSEGHLPDQPVRGDYLPRATQKALDLLSGDKDGFLLMVEGSLIDGASHARDAARTLAEMRDFERAVAVAMDFADEHPGTLVVVTADHETGGLTLPSGKSDFTLSESGIDYRFSTGSHTAVRVPAYFYGCGANRFEPMMENIELSERIMQLLRLRK